MLTDAAEGLGILHSALCSVKAGALRAVGRQNHLIHLACEGSNLTLLSEQHVFLAGALLVVPAHLCARALTRRLMTLLAADEWSTRARLVSVMYKAPSQSIGACDSDASNLCHPK